MSQAVAFTGSFRITSMARRPRLAKTKQKQNQSQRHIQSQSSTAMTIGFGSEKKKELLWQCVEGCGACCKLQKDPSFATPEEIFTDSSDVELYRSMIGPDGWCINYDKTTRKCSIYSDRPYFCRVESDVFQSLYGIPKKKFNQEACSSCKDTIKAIYGSSSNELDNFNRAIRSSTTSQNKLF